MQIVIDIPEEAYNEIMKDTITMSLDTQISVINAIQDGIVLPKGHGDLIDRKSISYENTCVVWSAEQGDTLECNAPTIIEADKEKENE